MPTSPILEKIELLAQPRQLGLFGAVAPQGDQVLPKQQSIEIARELAKSLEEPPLAHRESIARQLREQQERERREAEEQGLIDAVRAAALDTDRLLLVDARTIIDAAYHAAAARGKPDMSPSGVPVAGLRGFVSAMLKLLGSEKPTHAAAVFDHAAGAVLRQKIDPAYKADRPAKPLDHLAQIEMAKVFCEAMGLRVYCSPAAEADDVIATLVHRAPPAWSVVVSSTDKDLLALVDRPKTELTWWRDGLQHRAGGERDALDRLGVLPRQVTDYLALVGDNSDCIPGIKGIGKKTAVELLRLYGSLDGIYANWGGIAGRSAERTKTLLREGREAARKSKYLAQLRIDVDDLAIPSAWLIGELLRWDWSSVHSDWLRSLGKQLGIGWLERDPQAEPDAAGA